MNDLPKFIKTERTAAKLTQEQLALKAGVGLRFVRELEQGKRTLRMDTVNKVLKLFGKRLGPVDLQDDGSSLAWLPVKHNF